MINGTQHVEQFNGWLTISYVHFIIILPFFELDAVPHDIVEVSNNFWHFRVHHIN